MIDRDADRQRVALARLHALSRHRKQIQENYEELRDQLLPELDGDPVYFIDDTGVKRYAARINPELKEVDLELLDLLVPYDVLDEVAPRKVDMAAFQLAAAAGRIPKEVLVRVARIVPGSPRITFGNPNSGKD